jgi:hypothetical protein
VTEEGYARLDVPEIWSYDSGAIKIYQLQGEKYIQTETSLVFPNLNIQEIPSLIERYRMVGRRVFRQAIREWVRGQMEKEE